MKPTSARTGSHASVMTKSRTQSGARPQLARNTGPLSLLSGARVSVFLDIENLRGGAQDLGYWVSFAALADQLRQACRFVALHAFYSCEPGNDAWTQHMQRCGYRTHPRDIETIQTRQGELRLANSDSRLLFLAGHLLTDSTADLVLIASGDGDLVCELAAGIQSLPRPLPVLTLSLPGSTSRRLDVRTNRRLSANLELGADVLISHSSLTSQS